MKSTTVPIVGAGNDAVAFHFQHLHSGQVHTLPFGSYGPGGHSSDRTVRRSPRTVATDERVIEAPLRVGKCCEEPGEAGGDLLRCAMVRAGCDIAVPT